MTDYLNRCQFGDVRAVLRQMIADGVKVNCIVTSPPYWGLRSYLPADHADKPMEIGSEPTLKEFIASMTEVFMLAREVLADDGTCWINMGDAYAGGRGFTDSTTASRRRDDHEIPRSDVRVDGLKPKDLMGQPWRLAFALQNAGWWLRQDIIWHKPNPMPESVRDRCTKAHEYLFLLSKSDRYFFDADAIKESGAGQREWNEDTRGDGRDWRADGGAGSRAAKGPSGFGTPDKRNRRSVWTIPTQPYKGAHFATFPESLVEPCILAGCPAGGTVLDIFMGSGTTAHVAERLGRKWIGIDLDVRNEALQRGRLRQPSLELAA